MIVVADTGPLNYLILSDYIGLLHKLYGSVIVPNAVHRELLHPRAPLKVRQWVNNLPGWIEVRKPDASLSFSDLGAGESEAIAIALETKADFVLMDETLGRKIAVRNGTAVKGTLGVLEEAASQRLVHLPEAIKRLQTTGIFLSTELIKDVLQRWQNLH